MDDLVMDQIAYLAAQQLFDSVTILGKPDRVKVGFQKEEGNGRQQRIRLDHTPSNKRVQG